MKSFGNKVARIFMLVIGSVLTLSGIYIMIIGRKIFFDTLVNNLPFFLSGGILIYLGLTWRKAKPKKN
jgi:hypothetical protein